MVALVDDRASATHLFSRALLLPHHLSLFLFVCQPGNQWSGNFSNAVHFYKRGFANVQLPFNVWRETPGGGAVNFITGAGGFL